jgi:lipopolysaccharide/colanic/teichoic acid biosynthesis glycosyltransferase
MEAIPLATQINPPLADPRPAASEPAPAVVKLRRDRSPGGRALVKPAGYRWYPGFKVAADFVLASLLTLPALPIVILAALLVKLTSRGPAFYTQRRLGRNGRPFSIIKLRTMIHNCESLTGPRWSMPGDPRVTPLGWLLRKSHLDELPQLLNVLRGQMSLVGPRPERPEFVPELERALPSYRQRLNVRPGVTGLAQVQLPPDTDLESVRRKLAHDLYYVRHLSPWLDLRLLACTACYAAGIPFRLLSRLLRVPASTEIERSMRDLVPEAAPRRQSA